MPLEKPTVDLLGIKPARGGAKSTPARRSQKANSVKLRESIELSGMKLKLNPIIRAKIYFFIVYRIHDCAMRSAECGPACATRRHALRNVLGNVIEHGNLRRPVQVLEAAHVELLRA